MTFITPPLFQFLYLVPVSQLIALASKMANNIPTMQKTRFLQAWDTINFTIFHEFTYY